ncbi:MAG: hypothetical protein SF162_14605 [bacterium]|nr:hypothetical protein [bacterium]
MLAFGLLIPLRSLEGWLHQHIFKVGWLLTKNLHTTTILYYTFFLPGVVLHEVIVWLMAGVLNIRATGELSFPDKQEIAELKLTFVKYDTRRIGTFRLFLINLMPLIGGIAFIWFVVNQPLQTDLLIRFLNGDPAVDPGQAISRLIASPDVWLWLYLMFTVSATMTPDPAYLRGWRLLLPPLALIILVLIGLGVVNTVLTNLLISIAPGASLLTGVFAASIAVNLFMTAVLGGIESVIERVTGDSATFEKGKLVAMRREEILRMRAEQAEKARKAAQRQQQAAARASAGPPSIYRLPLPIPPAPDKDTILADAGQGALPGFAAAESLPAPPAALPATAAERSSTPVPPASPPRTTAFATSARSSMPAAAPAKGLFDAPEDEDAPTDEAAADAPKADDVPLTEDDTAETSGD